MHEKILGKTFIESLLKHVMNVDKPLEWVSEGPNQRLCVSKEPKPKLLEFWVTECISAQYLSAM